MKKFNRSAKVILSLVLILIGVSESLCAQVEAGVKFGASTLDYVNTPVKDIILGNEGVEEYRLGVEDINFGFHGGLYARLIVWKIFLQPEVLINSHTVDYKLEDFNNPSEFQILKEQYTKLDVPVLLGLKLDWFNIHAGVSGHLPLLSVSELKNIDGYSITPESFTYSYLGGIGFDFWRLRLDFRYELSTTFFGEQINFRGNNYRFEDKNDRLVAGISYKF